LKILLIEDDDDTAHYVAKGLRKAGHIVERVQSAEDGLALVRSRSHDIAIIDRMLPALDGLSLVKTMRAEGLQIPVLFLTTMSGIHDRVDGLEAGGDDYLVKPFALSELIARVNSLSRRTQRVSADVQTELRVGDLVLDLIGHTVRRAGEFIDLQPQEFRILEYLVRHAGQIVTRTMLLENVWQLHFDPQTNIVESHMSRIRTKLDRPFSTQMIQTIRGAGYILRAD
jgi:two-component system, OmpR family, response regulator